VDLTNNGMVNHYSRDVDHGSHCLARHRTAWNTVGILVDSEIVLSTRYGKTMVFINKLFLSSLKFVTHQSSMSSLIFLRTDWTQACADDTGNSLSRVISLMTREILNRSTHYPGNWIVSVSVRTEYPVQPFLYLSISKPYQLSSTDPPVSTVG
jgi:hypothetical protein